MSVPENYRPIVSADDLDGDALRDGEGSDLTFLKLSAACGLERWEEAQTILGGLFRVLVDVLADNHER